MDIVKSDVAQGAANRSEQGLRGIAPVRLGKKFAAAARGMLVALLTGVVAVAASPARADDAAARRELAPNGVLRVAIAVGPAPSGIYAVKDTASGSYRGVTIELSRALGEKLGVPVGFVPYLGSGEIQASAAANVWDVSFMPVDDERRTFVDFGSPYHILQSTYLVAPGSRLQTLADVNAPGIRVGGVKDTATLRASLRASPKAEHKILLGVDQLIEAMGRGDLDALALGRASLGGVAQKLPGSRILAESFLNSTTAIAVPKGRAAALAYVSAFIEEAKASGLVRRAFDSMGLKTEQVAPAGMAP